MIGFSLCYRWLHPPTPRGGVILVIAMFCRIVYRLRHQSDAGGKKKKNPTDGLLLIWIHFHTPPALLRSACHNDLHRDMSHLSEGTRTRPGVRRWGARQGGPQGSTSQPLRPDERSPIVCWRVKASALFKSRSVALSGRADSDTTAHIDTERQSGQSITLLNEDRINQEGPSDHSELNHHRLSGDKPVLSADSLKQWRKKKGGDVNSWQNLLSPRPRRCFFLFFSLVIILCIHLQEQPFKPVHQYQSICKGLLTLSDQRQTLS